MAKEKTEEPKIELVKMRRAAPQKLGGPTTADVHPDEVQNYLAGGWSIVPPPAKPDDGKPPAK
jgi:hypothetical protein